jgi:ribosome maturation factor RimP
MDMDISKEELEKRVGDVVEREGYELVEMKLARHGKHHTIRVFADCDEGITLDQCAAVSRAISRELDDLDPFEYSYKLEVSSPGLERPLKSAADFKRRKGVNVKVRCVDENGKQYQVNGRVENVEDDRLQLNTSKGLVELPMIQVRYGKVVF